MDSSAAIRRSFWRRTDCDPEPTSAFHSTESVAHQQQLISRKALGSYRSSLQTVRGGRNYISCCHVPVANKSNSYAAIVWRRTVFFCDIGCDKDQPARAHRGYPAGILQRKKKKDDDEQLAALYLCNIRVQYESNFSAMRNH